MCHPPAVDVDKHSDCRACQVCRGVVFLESLLSIPCLGIYGTRFGWRNQISTLAMLRQLVIHRQLPAAGGACLCSRLQMPCTVHAYACRSGSATTAPRSRCSNSAFQTCTEQVPRLIPVSILPNAESAGSRGPLSGPIKWGRACGFRFWISAYRRWHARSVGYFPLLYEWDGFLPGPGNPARLPFSPLPFLNNSFIDLLRLFLCQKLHYLHLSHRPYKPNKSRLQRFVRKPD